MKQVYARRKLMISTAVVAAVVGVGPCASAQTTTSTSMAISKPKKPPTSTTPKMIEEAIQRSQARSAKAQATGAPEKWGSEEPFTFDPTKQ